MNGWRDGGRTARAGEYLSSIMASVAEGVCAFDLDGKLRYANPAAEKLLGYRADQLEDASGGVSQATLASLGLAVERVLRWRSVATSEHATLVRRDGTHVPVSYTCAPMHVGEVAIGAVLAFRDVTERVRAERELAHHALHDQLTGLPNRRLFLDRLERALLRADRHETAHVVLFADVDRFKLINDNLGHQAGDRLLVTIANRLRETVKAEDTVSRFGGDEFTVLLEEVGDLTVARQIAERMRAAVARPVGVDGAREVMPSISIGIASTHGLCSADDVLHHADAAMYEAKLNSAEHVHLFDADEMATRSPAWLDLESELRQALAAGEIEVFYQPLVDTETGVIAELEALMRWRHPTDGLRPPTEFIGVAEETGLILPLGRLVLESACQQAREWNDRYGASVGVCVNLSAKQFQSADLVDDVRRELDRAGLPAGQLCLEITESLAMIDLERTIAVLGELRTIGVRLAIDDFGTGYSSLNYLKHFSVDVVKIDKSFVDELGSSPVDTEIVRAVINLGLTLGMTTVAEGVETEQQLVQLRALGCPLAQGYYLAEPMPEHRATALLTERSKAAIDVSIPHVPSPALTETRPAADPAPITAEDRATVSG